MMVCVDVADPDTLKASNYVIRFCAIAAPQLTVRPLPAIQQHPTLQAAQRMLHVTSVKTCCLQIWDA